MPEKQFITNTVYDEMAHSLRAMRVDEAQIKERVATVLEQIGLTGREHMSPYMLSHGQKRRLSVACMVIAEPEVIILDEPTFGQDYRQAQRIMTFMRDLADNGGAVAFITHDMRLVAEYADRCVAMCDGTTVLTAAHAVDLIVEAVHGRSRTGIQER